MAGPDDPQQAPAGGPAATTPPPYLAGLLLSGRPVLAVGGGEVNTRRIRRLLEAGAEVTVVSPALTDELAEHARSGRVRWVERGFVPTDADGAWYVLAATDSGAVNAQVAAAAEERHTFCVRADAADLGSAWTPAVGATPEATIAVLGHHSPRRSAELRDRLVALAADLAVPPSAQTGQSQGPVSVGLAGSLGSAGRPQPQTAPGEVTLVGGGPGDPGLLTIAGRQALREADVVLYDHLAPAASLAETRPDALLVDVAKIPGGRQVAQSEIEELLVQHARAGARVVRFKGGDAFVFGRGGEEWLACVAAGVGVRVIPGVSAAVAGPELAGIPLTHRGLSQGFSVVSGHVGPDDPASTVNWDALAQGNTTIVILMGVTHLNAICGGLVARGLASDTPAAVVASAATPDQLVLRGTVATLPGLAAAAGVRPPALTVIGAVAALDLRKTQP